MKNFYNKVAKKFGGYAFSKNTEKHTNEYPNGDPEKIFKKKLISLASNNKKILDVGCGDGKFAFSITKQFLRITGIDNSKELLKIAKEKKKILKIKNVFFDFQDATKTSFDNHSFDLIYSRRGPTPFPEFYRLLKPDGYFVGVRIGEKDCVDIKKIFNRGQGYGKWNISQLEIDNETLKKNGFEVIFSKDFFYDEYYPTYDDLDLFLQGVPIFEDFDSKKDRKYLEKYVDKFQTNKGIKFPRHKIVTIAKKVNSF